MFLLVVIPFCSAFKNTDQKELAIHSLSHIKLKVILTYIQGRFDNHAVHSLYMILVTELMLWRRGDEMGNIAPRGGLEPIFLLHSRPMC